MESFDFDVALQTAAVVAAAAAIGAIVTRRLPIPQPVLLLALGVIVGRDGLRIIEPDRIAELERVVIVLAVALIVFEGGTSINGRQLRALATPVRNLVVLGLIITTVVGAIAARMFLDFGWREAFLFGALVCVTGPSVITPLLQMVKVNTRVRHVLVSEGVIIDPFGALLTLFLLQLALADQLEPAGPTGWFIERVVTGVIVGAAGAGLVWLVPKIVARMSGDEISLLVTGAAITAFAIAESIGHEAGLTAMVVMGIALGNLEFPHHEALHRFQRSILPFLIATVYVLLAADISIDALRDLWPNGIYVVLALVLVGRPLLVFLSTWGSSLTMRERLFLAAVAPRGVVAASLAGVVAIEAGGLIQNQERFVAMVFVVIAVTVSVQSAYAGPLSKLLRVQPLVTLIAGSGDVGRRVAERLKNSGEDVVLVEHDEQQVVAAREAGFEVVLGDIGRAETLRKAGIGDAHSFILATPSDDRNLLAAQLAKADFGVENVYARVNDPDNMHAFQELGVVVVNPAEAVADELALMVTEPILSDLVSPADSDLTVARVVVTNASAQVRIQNAEALQGALVVLVRRGTSRIIPNGRTQLRLGDTVTMFGKTDAIERARRFLALGG
jgi:NhaP-type Na+/H+ or K+/H+ antiporter